MLAALATDDQKPSGGTQRPGKGLGRGRQLVGGLRFSHLREGMGKNTWDMAHSETTDLVVLTLPMIDFGVKNFKPPTISFPPCIVVWLPCNAIQTSIFVLFPLICMTVRVRSFEHLGFTAQFLPAAECFPTLSTPGCDCTGAATTSRKTWGVKKSFAEAEAYSQRKGLSNAVLQHDVGFPNWNLNVPYA